MMPKIHERAPDRLNDEELERLCMIDEPYGFLVRFLLSTGLRWGELKRASQGRSDEPTLPKSLLGELRGRVGKHGAFNKMVKELSGVTRFHVHQLRHSYACRWLEAGG